MKEVTTYTRSGKSPPTRGAWIEIIKAPTDMPATFVAPHTGGVD